MDIRKLIIIVLVVIGLFFVLYFALDWGGTENPIVNNYSTDQNTVAEEKENIVKNTKYFDEYKALRTKFYFEDGFCLDLSKMKDFEFAKTENSGKLNATFNLYNEGSEVTKDNSASISIEHITNFNNINLDVINEKYTDNINEKYYYGTVANSDTYVYGFVINKQYFAITITQLYYKNLNKEKADKIIEMIKPCIVAEEGTPIFDKVYDLKLFDSEISLSKENCGIDYLYNDGYMVEVNSDYDVEVLYTKDNNYANYKKKDSWGQGAYTFSNYVEDENDYDVIWEVQKGDDYMYYRVIGKCDTIEQFYPLFNETMYAE